MPTSLPPLENQFFVAGNTPVNNPIKINRRGSSAIAGEGNLDLKTSKPPRGPGRVGLKVNESI